MENTVGIIKLVIGIIIWLSMYLFVENKFGNIGKIKKKPIMRAMILFIYMYIGMVFLKTLI